MIQRPSSPEARMNDSRSWPRGLQRSQMIQVAGGLFGFHLGRISAGFWLVSHCCALAEEQPIGDRRRLRDGTVQPRLHPMPAAWKGAALSRSRREALPGTGAGRAGVRRKGSAILRIDRFRSSDSVRAVRARCAGDGRGDGHGASATGWPGSRVERRQETGGRARLDQRLRRLSRTKS